MKKPKAPSASELWEHFNALPSQFPLKDAPHTDPEFFVVSADGTKTDHPSITSARRHLAKLRREEVLKSMSPKRRNKHGNNVSYDAEGKWDSDAEKRRWPILKAMQKDGQIFDLRRQVRIPLHAFSVYPSGLIGYYIADFIYLTSIHDSDEDQRCFEYNLSEEGEPKSPKYPLKFHDQAVVEDVKGQRTEMYKWKRKHVHAEYGISIVEIKA